jgi:probable F420-dependent oxidoreductase
MCKRAEALGADSLWVVDHVVLPFNRQTKYPYVFTRDAFAPSDTPWWDPFSVLNYIAAGTSRVQLGTGVIVLPYRHPLWTAKAIATADVLSRGRILFGVGVGWMEDEFNALQLGTFHQRGRVADEQLEVFQRAWQDDHVSYEGEFYRFHDVSVTPKPVQKPGPPIVIGGNTDAALRRTVKYAQGWHGLSLLPDELKALDRRLQTMAKDAGRRDRIPVSMLIGVRLTKEPVDLAALDDDDRRSAVSGTPEQVVAQLKAYGDAGLEHLMTFASTEESILSGDPVGGADVFLREVAPQLR